MFDFLLFGGLEEGGGGGGGGGGAWMGVFFIGGFFPDGS